MNRGRGSDESVREALAPLGAITWDGSGCREALEKQVLRRLQKSRQRRNHAFVALTAATFVALIGASVHATGAIASWWQSFTYEETDNGDGTFRLIVTDENGSVDLDESFVNGTGILHTEDGGFVEIEPCEASEKESILKELESLNEPTGDVQR
jgi:hypothetical protein